MKLGQAAAQMKRPREMQSGVCNYLYYHRSFSVKWRQVIIKNSFFFPSFERRFLLTSNINRNISAWRCLYLQNQYTFLNKMPIPSNRIYFCQFNYNVITTVFTTPGLITIIRSLTKLPSLYTFDYYQNVGKISDQLLTEFILNLIPWYL